MPQPQGITIAREQAAPEKTEATTTTDTSGGTYDENVETVSNQEKALRIATYYRCLNLRANTMAQLTVQYQRLNKDGGNFVQDNYGKAGELNYLLQREPNPLTTAFNLWRQVEIDTVARGNGFVYVERDDDGWPMRFWLSRLAGYDPVNDQFMLVYRGIGGLKTVTVSSRDVLHFPNTFLTEDGCLGVSTLFYARQMLTLSATLDKSALETAAKGGPGNPVETLRQRRGGPARTRQNPKHQHERTGHATLRPAAVRRGRDMPLSGRSEVIGHGWLEQQLQDPGGRPLGLPDELHPAEAQTRRG